jgi:hypothetical protein
VLAPATIPVTTGYVYGTRVNISVYVGRGGTCAGTKVHIDYPVQEVLWWSAGIANRINSSRIEQGIDALFRTIGGKGVSALLAFAVRIDFLE